jgi:hypothetical protein
VRQARRFLLLAWGLGRLLAGWWLLLLVPANGHRYSSATFSCSLHPAFTFALTSSLLGAYRRVRLLARDRTMVYGAR